MMMSTEIDARFTALVGAFPPAAINGSALFVSDEMLPQQLIQAYDTESQRAQHLSKVDTRPENADGGLKEPGDRYALIVFLCSGHLTGQDSVDLERLTGSLEPRGRMVVIGPGDSVLRANLELSQGDPFERVGFFQIKAMLGVATGQELVSTVGNRTLAFRSAQAFLPSGSGLEEFFHRRELVCSCAVWGPPVAGTGAVVGGAEIAEEITVIGVVSDHVVSFSDPRASGAEQHLYDRGLEAERELFVQELRLARSHLELLLASGGAVGVKNSGRRLRPSRTRIFRKVGSVLKRFLERG